MVKYTYLRLERPFLHSFVPLFQNWQEQLSFQCIDRQWSELISVWISFCYTFFFCTNPARMKSLSLWFKLTSFCALCSRANFFCNLFFDDVSERWKKSQSRLCHAMNECILRLLHTTKVNSNSLTIKREKRVQVTRHLMDSVLRSRQNISKCMFGISFQMKFETSIIISSETFAITKEKLFLN